jgi:signal peptidase II
MTFTLHNKYIKLFTIAGIILILDQATKAMITNSMALYQSIPVIPGFFSITHIHNPGGAFGFLADQGPAVRTVMFLVVSSLAVGLILYFYKNTPRTHPYLQIGFALIFGGAVGNLIDRVRFGKVVDFLDVYIRQMHWPAFNVADSAISIGMVIFMYHVLFKKMPE